MDLQGPRGQPPPSPHRRMKRTGISASSLPPGLTVASPDASPSSALTSRTTPSHSQIQLYSCLQCKHRKVKCDRIDPCGNCEKAGAECVYRTPPPPKRKKRKHQQGDAFEKGSTTGNEDAETPLYAINSTSEREHELLEKIRKYESLLKDLGALKRSTVHSPDKRTHYTLSDRSRRTSQQTSHSSELVNPGAGKLIAEHGRSRYLENKLWTSVTDEFQDPKEMLEGSTDDEGEHDSPIEGEFLSQSGRDRERHFTPNPTDLIFPVGGSDRPLGLRSLHPQPTQVFLLWQAFVDNVNPLMKILHVPTAQKAVLSAMADLDRVSKGMEALLFGIYTIAVTSMDDGECQSTLQKSKASALRSFRAGSQEALRAASLLKTSDIMVLQAFVLFLLSARLYYDAYSLWSLAGICQRIGQRIGLHRDGEKLGISPFETEMRRRLWLVIVQFDSRTGELSGSGLSITTQSWDTKPPLNVNDCDLYPEMREQPVERETATEMMFVLLRAQIGVFLTKGKPAVDIFDGVYSRFSDSAVHMAEKNREIDELEQMLEERVIRHCDQEIPVHHLTSLIAKAVICKMRLFAHLPLVMRTSSGTKTALASLSLAEESLLFTNSLQIVEYQIQIRSAPTLRRFLWHTQIQWQALVYLLAYLRTHPNQDSRTDMAWTTIDKLFACHPELVRGDRTRSKMRNAVSILTLKAWDARESASSPLNTANNSAFPPPSCIAQLREQSLHSTGAPSRVVAAPGEVTSTATVPLHEENHNVQTHARTNTVSEHGNILQGHEAADRFNPDAALQLEGGHPAVATDPFTSSTADLSWIDANPMDWENWNSIYEDFEMQDQWGDILSFPE